MKIINNSSALKGLKQINDEISYKSCFEEKNFTTGIITFQPQKNSDRKQINHVDKDVVCHVLKGRGRLRVKGRRIQLSAGMICHIPKGTPHDFAAHQRSRLVLFYSLIQTS